VAVAVGSRPAASPGGKQDGTGIIHHDVSRAVPSATAVTGAQARGEATVTLRYFTFTLVPQGDNGFHPGFVEVRAHPDIKLEQLRYVNLLGDKSGVALTGGRGNEEAVREAIGRAEYMLDWAFIPGDGDRFHLYLHFEAMEPGLGLLELLDDYRLVPELPFEFTARGNLRVTVVGTDENIRQALASVPDSIDAQATEMGQYDPDDDRAIARLTDRQREVLEAAIELGYYEVPRQATYEDIAEVCDCTVGTVGEHLNRVESRILHAALGR